MWGMRAFLALLLALFMAGPAAAHSYKVGGIMVGHVWVTPTTTGNSEVFVSLLNKAGAADQLIAVFAPSAQAVGVFDAASRRIGAVDLPVNRPVSLKPGGTRIVLAGVDRPLRVGDRLKLTLVFAKAGTVAVEAMVEAGPSHG